MDVQVKCVCPSNSNDGTPRHPDGDTITLRERLDFDQAMSCKQATQLVEGDDAEATLALQLAALVRQYLFVGIERWTLMNGKAIPVTASAIREYILSDFGVANVVSDEAEKLYNGQVLRPLLVPASKSSGHMPTAGSTSAMTSSTSKPRTRSSQSSTSTTRTAGTAKTRKPRGGGSNS